MATAIVVLAALVAALALTVRTRSGGAAWALVVLSALWLVADQPVEGPLLVGFSASHSLTLADLLAGLGAVVALAVLIDRAVRIHPRDVRSAALATTVGVWWTVLALGALLAVTLG